MLIQSHAPTDALRETLVALLTNGVPSLDLDPPFPGIAIHQDDVPEEAVAPFILIDCTDAPVTHGKTSLWRHTIRISLTQPVEEPTDPAVDPAYKFASAAAYEANLHALLTGRLPKAGETYDEADRSTYLLLSDLLALTATELGNGLQVVDTWALHRPDCAIAGLPVRQKLATSTDQELEYEFVLVAALEEAVSP
ncbi:MAG: hypothetical protein KA004_19240 [Verrucomicrobiales bacterium]|nr:hypothetical protein [Verrucomicrobiales bacterium]